MFLSNNCLEAAGLDNITEKLMRRRLTFALAACRTEALRLNAESDFVVAGFRLALDRTLIPV
jgi:hypothetical protein